MSIWPLETKINPALYCNFKKSTERIVIRLLLSKMMSRLPIMRRKKKQSLQQRLKTFSKMMSRLPIMSEKKAIFATKT